MGGGHSKPECNNNEQSTNTVAPTPPFSFWERTKTTGNAGHSSPCALDPPFDPHSGQDPPAKLSSPEEALTYASMTFQIAEKNHHLTEKHSAGLDPVVYSQIKVTNSPDLSREA
ncbi:transmembrane protein C1orf162 homolog isoform X2 [Felis catus]|uniref:transmembrane protein C1orf162 homolog isoform X2 n=1 Tax=Felis catus TaxID=9685 RepID=UPI001D19E3B6|nr:transmembrane protein C1orf162 homolog isoform X2 [Felis catus]